MTENSDASCNPARSSHPRRPSLTASAQAHHTHEAGRPRRLLDRPVGATDRGAKGTASKTAPTQPPRERSDDMRSNHARHVSETLARYGRPEPDMPTTAFSSTRRVAHCGLNRIHGYYQTGHRTTENTGSPGVRNITNASGEIRRPGSGRRQDLLNQELLTVRVVRYGNKQNTQVAVDPGEVFGNFFPFDTDPTCQWRGRRRCGPRCEVS